MTTIDEAHVSAAPLVDFDRFHRVELPARLADGRGAQAYGDLAEIGALAIRSAESGASYTYALEDGTVRIVEGDDGARTVVELDAVSFDGLAHDLDTVPGLLYRGKVTAVRGGVRRFLRWEAALRCLYHGIPIFDPDHVELSDDPARIFSLDDDRAEMASFLHEMGYLVVRDVFSPEEVATMLAAAERLHAGAREGDHASWWGKNDVGDSLCTRVLTGGREPSIASLYDDERLLGLAALSEFDLEPRGRYGERGATVLWKLPNMVEGLGDIPWHRDCGMGGHAVNCPLLIASVCLTDGSAAAGELRVLPGSWRGSVNFMKPDDPSAPAGVPLAVTAGGVSFHYSDSMHASMAPTPGSTGPFRCSALVAYTPPQAHNHHEGERTYNDPLLTRRDGQVEHLDKIVDRLAP